MIKRNINTKETAKEYFFIRNLQQALYFMQHGLKLQDLRLERTREEGRKRLTFIFYRDNKAEKVFSNWCSGDREIDEVLVETSSIKNISKNLFLCQNGCIPIGLTQDENNNILFMYENSKNFIDKLLYYKNNVK